MLLSVLFIAELYGQVQALTQHDVELQLPVSSCSSARGDSVRSSSSLM